MVLHRKRWLIAAVGLLAAYCSPGICDLLVGRHIKRPPASIQSSGESEHSADIR